MVICARCQEDTDSVIRSRLNPDSYLHHDSETGYAVYHYCEPCHLALLTAVWTRLRSTERSGDNPAPTAI